MAEVEGPKRAREPSSAAEGEAEGKRSRADTGVSAKLKNVSSLLSNLAERKAAIQKQLQEKQLEHARQRAEAAAQQIEPVRSSNPSVKEAIAKARAVAAQAATTQGRLGGIKGRGFQPPPLLLDKDGREVDESGKLLTKAALVNVTTTKANKKYRLQSLLQSAEETNEATRDPDRNQHFDPRMHLKEKGRQRRAFNFVQSGTYVKRAEKMRQRALKEALKERGEYVEENDAEIEEEEESNPNLIALGTKALQDRIDPAIPDVEWWDSSFVSGGRAYPAYCFSDLSDWSDASAALQISETQEAAPNLFMDRATSLVEHPPAVSLPSASRKPPMLPLMLTKKERVKLRKRTRQESLKEKQERVLVGLEEPDKPKVKLSNLMRVLTAEAVADPTEIEKRVRGEMAQRRINHERRNQERKLTKDERKEKIRNKLREDSKWATHVVLFRVSDLGDPSKRFKVDTNAQSLLLSGCVLLTPTCNLVIAEGGARAMRQYKKIMLRKIKWNAVKVGSARNNEDEEDGDSTDNKCELVWEGQVRKPCFRNFSFESLKSGERARKYLQHRNVEHYWDLAIAHSFD